MLGKRFITAVLNAVLSAGILIGLSACGGAGEGTYSGPFPKDSHPPSQIRWDQLEILFPVVGKAKFTNDWQAPRDGGKRRHEGNDLIAKKMAPVVAVADGTVAWVRAKKGAECCYLAVAHESQGHRFESRYIHLNNDTPGTDDGKMIGIAKGIKKGVKVQAGQLIGWAGDSGNAEGTVSHLHFELRDEYLRAVNPYSILMRAKRLDRVLVGAQSPTQYKTTHEQDDLEDLPRSSWPVAKPD